MDSRHLHGILLVVILTIAISQPVGAMTAEEWYDKGLALYQQGKYTDAIKAYNRAITLDPTVATFWNGLGTALDHEGDYTAAIRAYNTAIDLDPTDAFTWNNKGISLDNRGNHTEAVAAFDRAIALDPSKRQYLECQRDRPESPGQLHCRDRGLRQSDSSQTEAMRIPGTTGATPSPNRGTYTAAIEAYDRAIELDPAYASPWNGKGNALENQGNYYRRDRGLRQGDRARPPIGRGEAESRTRRRESAGITECNPVDHGDAGR